MATVVIKIGGSTLEALEEEFYEGVVKRASQGDKIMIVHGGGPAINNLLQAMAVESQFVDGLRKTTAGVLTAAEAALSGQINKQLVRSLYRVGGKAVGLSGSDGHLLKTIPIDTDKLGFVGAVESVNVDLLFNVAKAGYIPVIAPIGMDANYQSYNINADTAAAAVAKASKAEELVFVTDVDGVQKDGKVIEEMDEVLAKRYIEEGVIYGGMVPKVNACLDSLSGALTKARIVSGKKAYHPSAGTAIVKPSNVLTSGA
ncbi:acetylglutamate kinase [Shouchella clausii]|nr:acetylglutamate kinase [Shouchella clausii]